MPKKKLPDKKLAKYYKLLKDEWITYLYILFSPVVLTFLCITVLLLYSNISANDIPANQAQASENLTFILTFLLSIVSGLLGGIIAKKWSDFSEENIMTVRGQSAIRSLQNVWGSIRGLKFYVNDVLHRYVQTLPKKKTKSEVSNGTQAHLESVIRQCDILEDALLNAMEDWLDIVPDMDEARKEIEEIDRLAKRVEELEIKLVKKDTSIDTEELRSELSEIRGKMREVEHNLSEKGFGNITKSPDILSHVGPKVSKKLDGKG